VQVLREPLAKQRCSSARQDADGWRFVTALRLIVWLSACALMTSPLAGQDETKVQDITFDTLAFEMEKGGPFRREMLTSTIEALESKTIRIRGYMLPSFQQRGITQFVLVRDNMQCCFGPGAALYDCVLVEMEAGKSTSYTVRPISVEGKFAIREFKDPDGKHLAIYHLTGHAVK
jgi:hypothetical protein